MAITEVLEPWTTGLPPANGRLPPAARTGLGPQRSVPCASLPGWPGHEGDLVTRPGLDGGLRQREHAEVQRARACVLCDRQVAEEDGRLLQVCCPS